MGDSCTIFRYFPFLSFDISIIFEDTVIWYFPYFLPIIPYFWLLTPTFWFFLFFIKIPIFNNSLYIKMHFITKKLETEIWEMKCFHFLKWMGYSSKILSRKFVKFCVLIGYKSYHWDSNRFNLNCFDHISNKPITFLLM